MKGHIGFSAARYLVSLSFLLGACGPVGDPARLDLRFARQSYRQTAGDGLPEQVGSLVVEVYQDGLRGSPAYQSECFAVGGDGARERLTLDLPAGSGLLLAVRAYPEAGCPAGREEWFGTSAAVDIVAGEKLTVPVYVARRGDTLNLVRGSLRPARAFASATTLADGQVLVAGGFELLQGAGGQVQLLASNRAALYHPGRAKFLPTGSLSEPRGAHQALLLPDGRVLLVGGCRQLDIHQQAGGHFSMAPQQLLATADVYDPASGTFAPAGPDPLLQRFAAAAVVLPDGNVLLAGGKTNLERSDELVLGTANGNDFEWSRLSNRLLAPRKGARALVLEAGASVVVGGGATQAPALESAGSAELAFQPYEPGAAQDLQAGGMGLTVLGSHLAWSGGLPLAAGQVPSDGLLLLDYPGPQVAASATMTRARAFHLAAVLAGPPASAGPRLLLVGGIDADFVPRADLEICRADEPDCRAVAAAEPGFGALGAAAAELLDGSVLLAGGLDWREGQFVVSGEARLFSP